MCSVRHSNFPVVTGSSAKHTISYAIYSSMMNPLKSIYATLAACAAVFAKKDCKNSADDGIEIAGKPLTGPGCPNTQERLKTTVRFPGEPAL